MKKINKVIKLLITGEIVLWGGLGFIIPILAVFITDQIKGGDVMVAGFAAAIYWSVKSIATVPFGYFLDKIKGEKDDLYFIVIGNCLAALAMFGYTMAELPWHVYVLQAIYGLGISMNIPAFGAIFIRHVDKGREAFEYGLDSALISAGIAVTGALGGVMAKYLGFNILFILIGLLIILSALIHLFIIDNLIKPKSVSFLAKQSQQAKQLYHVDQIKKIKK